MSVFKRSISLLSGLAVLLALPSSISAYYDGMAASVVIGQRDFFSGAVNQGGTPSSETLNAPMGVYVDPNSKKLFVADTANNRVLIYNSVPTQNNAKADLVIGQPTFSAVAANQGGSANSTTLKVPSNMLVVDGRLLVADAGNHRVLIYNSIPTSNNAAADVVIGQPDMLGSTANNGGRSARTLSTNGALGLASDGQKLFVSDSGNNRVLIYNSVPTSNFAAADLVLGQPGFTSAGNGLTATTFNSPIGILVVNQKLLVGDVNNSRTLVWNKIPTANQTAADLVIGRSDLTSGVLPSPPYVSRRPTAMAWDGTRLFIANDYRSMVAVYNDGIPNRNFAPYDFTLGVHLVSTLDASHMWGPWGVTTIDNKVIISSTDGYNRVLVFENQISKPGLSLSGTPEARDNSLVRLKGNTSADSPYRVKNVEYSINGGSFSGAVAADGGFDEVSEEYYFDFDPNATRIKDNIGNTIDGYTARVRSTNNNTDVTDRLFFFSPFDLQAPADGASISSAQPTFEFTVNKQSTTMKDNLSKYQVQVKKGTSESSSAWETLIDNIPIDFRSVKNDPINKTREQWQHLDTSNGVYETDELSAVYSDDSSRIKVDSKSSVLSGNYQWRVVAVDRSGRSQETGSRNLTVNALGSLSNAFPVAILNISGLGNPQLNSFDAGNVRSVYRTSSSNPVFYGTAWRNSKVTLTITDQICQVDCGRTYSTIANADSRFGINVPKGDLSYGKNYTARLQVSLDNMYNELPTFTLGIGELSAVTDSSVILPSLAPSNVTEVSNNLDKKATPTPSPITTSNDSDNGKRCIWFLCF